MSMQRLFASTNTMHSRPARSYARTSTRPFAHTRLFLRSSSKATSSTDMHSPPLIHPYTSSRSHGKTRISRTRISYCGCSPCLSIALLLLTPRPNISSSSSSYLSSTHTDIHMQFLSIQRLLILVFSLISHRKRSCSPPGLATRAAWLYACLHIKLIESAVERQWICAII